MRGPSIVAKLASDKARAAYVDIQDQIEELRAAFQPLEQIAERYRLPLTTVTLTVAGTELSAVPGLAEADRAKAAQAIFAAEVGKLDRYRHLWRQPTIYGSTSATSRLHATRRSTKSATPSPPPGSPPRPTSCSRPRSTKSSPTSTAASRSPDVAAERSQFATISPAVHPRRRRHHGSQPGGRDQRLLRRSRQPRLGGQRRRRLPRLPRHRRHPADHRTGRRHHATSSTNATRDGLYADFIAGLTDEMWPQNVRGSAYQRMLTLLTTTTTTQ